MAAMRPRRVPAVLWLALATSCATGPEETPPPAGPLLVVISGSGQSDSILGRFARPIEVMLLGTNGTRPRGVPIIFSAPVVASSSPFGGRFPIAGFSTDSNAQRGPSFDLPADLTTKTDSTGRVMVWIVASFTSGTGQIRIEAPTADVRVEVPITVRPGNAAELWLEPRDTAITVGTSYPLRALVLDGFRNALSTVPVLTIAPTGVSLQGTTVSGSAPTRAQIRASSGGLSATAAVSVVPSGTLFASRSPRFSGDNSVLVSLRTDGSGARVIAAGPGFDVANPRANVARDRIIFGSGFRDSYLLVADTLGRVQRFLQGGPAGNEETSPRYSPDGRFVFFTADGALWRADTDGTNARRLGAPSAGSDNDSQVSASPDGRTLAYTGSGPVGQFIRLMDLASGAVTETLVRGSHPEYSPDGTRLAFRVGQSVGEMKPDGTGVRILSAPSSLIDFGTGLTWSPDGQWLATGGITGLVLVNATDGRVIPIPGTERLVDPVWR